VQTKKKKKKKKIPMGEDEKAGEGREKIVIDEKE